VTATSSRSIRSGSVNRVDSKFSPRLLTQVSGLIPISNYRIQSAQVSLLFGGLGRSLLSFGSWGGGFRGDDANLESATARESHIPAPKSRPNAKGDAMRHPILRLSLKDNLSAAGVVIESPCYVEGHQRYRGCGNLLS
jgi:hypothetical protein